ncbi:cilium assembly protein DZIP1L-like [Manis pentadactyla]|uniref:cilium assembly protein DZIP1L-like n=1 Tax=Manis pentadactyla TaxID=143292 RepID=UPI00255C6711|nr:cilium assembly protein DZIP1L-like [Manis pentadactyla]
MVGAEAPATPGRDLTVCRGSPVPGPAGRQRRFGPGGLCPLPPVVPGPQGWESTPGPHSGDGSETGRGAALLGLLWPRYPGGKQSRTPRTGLPGVDGVGYLLLETSPLSAPLPAAVALGAPTPGGQPRASPTHTVLHNHSLGLQCIDWRHISTLDVDRVAREVDVAILQELLNGVTFCNLDREVCSHYGQPVDPALLKILRLTQFIIEYLLHCQDCLSASVVQLEARLQASLEQQECGQQELARQADELKGVRQESHRRRKLIGTLQQLLLHTGAYSYHPVRNLCRAYILWSEKMLDRISIFLNLF